MKIKDTLDLCGWELWNFCIQNHQNLEGLLDMGAGRKVFYTGNDQGKNGREVIYDGSKWKVSAYMSDVDELRGLITALENATDEEIEALKGRATTLEGRVDTIDNMLNVENSQTVVDTWEEVKKFLASVSEETDLITLLNGKANWSADIAIDDIKTLGYGKNSGTTGWIYNGPAISFGANPTYFAQLQVNFQKDNLVFRRHTNEGFSDWREVLHQGNFVDLIGNTYLKTTGGTVNGNTDFVGMTKLIRNATFPLYVETTDTGALGVGIRFRQNGTNTIGLFADFKTDMLFRYSRDLTELYTILDTGNYVGLIGNTYLKTTGGTINGDLRINRGESQNYITFEVKNVAQGYLGFNGADNPIYIPSAANAIYTLLHQGNYSDLITTLNGNLSVGGNVTAVGGAFSVVSIGNNTTDGTELLRFKTDRPWVFKQIGEEAATGLVLAPTTTSKMFYISEPTGEARFTFAVNGASSSLSVNGDFYVTKHAYFNDVVTCDKSVIAKELIIDGIKLSVENGLLKIEGSAFATGELAAGGAGAEGEGGAGGFSLYESWGTSAPTEPLALGANLGYELKTRVEDLELAKTKVEISDTLVSGKPIGAITIDGNTTNLFAPATYAWSEITSKPTTLAGYGITDALSTAGGVLTLDTTDSFVIRKTVNYISLIRFDGLVGKDITPLGYFGFYGVNNPVFYDTTKNSFTLLHQGNFENLIDNTYLKTDGSNAMGAGKYMNWEGSNIGGEDYNSFGYGIRLLSYNISTGDYRGGLFVGTRYGFQLTRQDKGNTDFFTVRFNDPNNNNAWGDWKTLAFTDSDITGNAGGLSIGKIEVNNDITVLNNLFETKFDVRFATGLADIIQGSSDGIIVNYGYSRLYGQQWFLEEIRHTIKVRANNNGTWSDWKTIAFTDSDITGNAATATALKNKVSLWGNEFDGTQNLSKHIYLHEGNNIAWTIGETNVNNIVTGSTGNFLLGSGGAQLGYNTYLNGNYIYLRSGKSQATAMTITDGGNVLIGTTTDEDVKFTVSGGTSIRLGYHTINTAAGIPTKASEINPQATFSLIRSYDNRYGLHTWIQSNGDVYVQSSYADQDKDGCHVLNLNPLGGAVNIASADAHTNVLGHLFASKDLYMSGFLMMNHGKEGIYMTGKTISWHNTNDAYTDSLLTFAKDSFTIHPNLYANGLANFSSRVLIGAVTDDTESALQVKGKITVGHSALDRLILTTQDVTAVFDGHDELDGWMDYVFKSDGTELFYIGAKESATSRFRRPIRFYGTVTIGGSLVAEGASTFGGQSTFNALALFNKPIVAKDTLQIGDATLMWDGNKKALVVDKSFASMGEVSAGGAGTEGGNTGGGGTGTITNPDVEYYNPKYNATHTFYHNLPYYDVVVQVYEKNAISGAWDMILADVTIANESNLVTVNFGRKEDVEHKIVVR